MEEKRKSAEFLQHNKEIERVNKQYTALSFQVIRTYKRILNACLVLLFIVLFVVVYSKYSI